jgi:hypothetical protein
MDRPSKDINHRIAAQARGLRGGPATFIRRLGIQERGEPLNDLAHRARRGQPYGSPAGAPGLGPGVPLARMFDAPADESATPQPIVRHPGQPQWRDPASGYLRRNVSPLHWPSPIQILEVDFPAGPRVSYETRSRDLPVHQQVWVLSGRIQVTLAMSGNACTRRDCLAMLLDRPIVFANRTLHPARYVVVISAKTAFSRRAI